MIRLRESIHVRQPIEATFRYVSDFSRIQEWDPGVAASRMRAPDPAGRPAPGKGSAFDLVLKFGPFRPKMRYWITDCQPWSKVVLKGRGDTFSAEDTITFSQDGNGTRIDYQADIRFSGPARHLEPFLSPLLKQAGKAAVLGLERQLSPRPPRSHAGGGETSGTHWLDSLADHTILPGMFLFSRLGYELGSRFWKPTGTTLFGKNVVLTGGTSGIGRAAAFELARKQAALTIVARNRKKAEQVCRRIIRETGNPRVNYLLADLSLVRDITALVRQIRDRVRRVDILINNAGALFNQRQETDEGHELTFATDLLGVFCLTMGVAPLMSGPDPRIISVSSGGMYTQGIDVEDLENRKGVYNGAKAYARAKRGIVILTRLWARRFQPQGIAVHAMHPGWVDTPGIRQALPGFHALAGPFLRSPDQGADTIVWLALSREAGMSTGSFWLDRRPQETVVFPGTFTSEKQMEGLWHHLSRLAQTP